MLDTARPNEQEDFGMAEDGGRFNLIMDFPDWIEGRAQVVSISLPWPGRNLRTAYLLFRAN
jgi:hypothetical protein